MLTTVPAHVTGDVFPASDWNTYVENNVNYLIVSAQTGWRDLSGYGTFTYNSTDGPTFVMNTPVDLTGVIGPGCRIKLTQTTVKYFIVTAIDAGTITLYGGTDYTLVSAAITAPSWSQDKAPLGFPLSPAKWTETTKDTSSAIQNSPTVGTWYNPGSLSLSVPIGAWRLRWQATIDGGGSGTDLSMRATLSTSNSSESDNEFSAAMEFGAAGNLSEISATLSPAKAIAVAAKTSYFLNIKSVTGVTTFVRFIGSAAPTLIRAECAYL